MAEEQIESILAADCGSSTTTVVLIDLVDGKHRLVAAGRAASTYAAPWNDITVGVQKAVRQIEKATQRTILTPGGRPITPRTANQQGVDAFVAVSSAGPPLRVLLVGLMEQLTLASAHRAAASTYTRVTNTLSLDAGPANLPEGDDLQVDQYSVEARLRAIREERSDVILLVGGTDGGAERPVVGLANVIAMALRVLNGVEKPAILFAGNQQLRAQIAKILGPITELKAIDNVRPALEIENLAAAQAELENLYIQRKMQRLPGFQTLANWTRYGIMPGGKSFEKVIGYVGRHNGWNVLGAQIGSGATTICTQAEDKLSSIIRSDAGVGQGLASLLKKVSLEKIHRWLPFDMALEELHNRLLNKALHPDSLPDTHEELMIDYAVAREALRLVAEQARIDWPLQPAIGLRNIHWNLIVGAGLILNQTPQQGAAAMLLLDGLEPWGVTSLALDRNGLANLLGVMATIQPEAAVTVTAQDAFLNLGTVIAPAGHGQTQKPALKYKIIYQDESTAEGEVPYGVVELVALPARQKATLEIHPTRHFDIGLGQPGRGAIVSEVEGGPLGIIIDARGRPLKLPRDDEHRRQQLEQWLAIFNDTHATSKEKH